MKIKLLEVDTSGLVPYPRIDIEPYDLLEDLKLSGGYPLIGKFPDLDIFVTDGEEVPPGLPDYFTSVSLKIISKKKIKIVP